MSAGSTPLLALAAALLTSPTPADTGALVRLNKEGLDLYAKGSYAQATDDFRSALGLAEKALPPEDPSCTTIRLNLANSLRELKRYGEAEAAFERVIAADLRTLGADNPDTLRVRNQRAVCLYDEGKFAAASDEFLSILRIQERVLGVKHPETIQTNDNLIASNRAIAALEEQDAEREKQQKSRDEEKFNWTSNAVVFLLFGVPYTVRLSRRLRARRPGARSFVWGYLVALAASMFLLMVYNALRNIYSVAENSSIFGLVVALLYYVALGVAGVYSLLRKRWAFITAVVLLAPGPWLALNGRPLGLLLSGAWLLVNGIYLSRRWRDMRADEGGRYFDLSPSRRSSTSSEVGRAPEALQPTDWRERLVKALSGPGVSEATWRPSRFHTARSFMLAGGAFIVGLTVLIVFGDQAERVPGASLALIVICLGGPFVLAARVLQNFTLRNRQKHLGYSAIERVRKAKHPPAIYLRAFNFDDEATAMSLLTRLTGLIVEGAGANTPEASLAWTLHLNGVPLLAIGRPGQARPPVGAARVHVTDEHWRQFVEDLIPLSSFVVLATGQTAGLRWEIEHLIGRIPPNRLLLWPHVGVTHWSAREQAADWDQFLARSQDAFPKPLPPQIVGVDFIAFGDDWTPKPIPGPDQDFTIWERWTIFPPWLYLRDFLREKTS